MFRTMLAVVMFGLCGTAAAENYVGAGVGQLRLEGADDIGAKIFGGWRFNQNLALEVAYFEGGTVDDDVAGVRVQTEPRALQLSAIGAIPVTDNFQVYARAGVLSWKAETVVDNWATTKDDGKDFSWGLGTSFDIGSRGAIRLEYEGADLDGTDISLISLSGVLRFGAD